MGGCVAAVTQNWIFTNLNLIRYSWQRLRHIVPLQPLLFGLVWSVASVLWLVVHIFVKLIVMVASQGQFIGTDSPLLYQLSYVVVYNKKRVTLLSNSLFCGATRNRTGDTRIFSPLLYQLSYGTNTVLLNCGCKGTTNIWYLQVFCKEFFANCH